MPSELYHFVYRLRTTYFPVFPRTGGSQRVPSCPVGSPPRGSGRSPDHPRFEQKMSHTTAKKIVVLHGIQADELPDLDKDPDEFDNL